MRALALVSLLLVACGTASSGPAVARPAASASAAPIASPTPSSAVVTASGGPFAVVFGSGPGGQFLTIVGTDGKLHGQVSPRSRSGDWGFQPSVSTSNSAVYYLDGDAALMRLRPGGAPEHVRDIPGTASVHATFAVSPDDSRIAIALLTYGPTTGPVNGTANYRGMKLYVEHLDGSHHVDLFKSPTVAEWPVGWHGGDLVIAVGVKQVPGIGLNPYPYLALGGIHVVNAVTGVRKASLCGGHPELGLATSAGVLCAEPSGTTIVESDWGGKETPTGLDCTTAILQPGGTDIACAGFGGTFLWTGGTKRPLPAPSLGSDPFTPLCWVGQDHLLLKSPYTGPVLLDIRTGVTQTVDTLADWTVGAIPGGL